MPNPFFGVSSATFPDADQKILTLVDGGLDGQVTPYQPLLVKARGVDTILAIDAVADTDENWAAGLSMIVSTAAPSLSRGVSRRCGGGRVALC